MQRTFNPMEDLERIWARWLLREYTHANLYYRMKLKAPVLEVGDIGAKHGCWNPLTRVLSIHRNTIRKYPWNEVVDILKHEMAHQWVTDFGSPGEPAHGAEFKKACEKLGLPDWAIGARGDLPGEIPDWRATALNPDEQRLISKVNKLLALAGSENQHEAELAMQRVQEMYARYNLERLEQQKQSQFVSWIQVAKTRKREMWEKILLSLLNEYFFVQVIQSKQFDARDCVEYPSAEIMGTRENVLMAEYVYNFLVQTLESLWQRQRCEQPEWKGSTLRRERRTYLIGVIHGFRARLADRSSTGQSTGPTKNQIHSLVVHSNQELQKHIQRKYPRTRSGRSGTVDLGSESYKKGKTDGSQIRLHRPLAHSDGNRGKLLGS